MRFIELTSLADNKMYINMDRIDEIATSECEDATVVFVGGGQDPFYVNESPQEIFKKIKELEEQ